MAKRPASLRFYPMGNQAGFKGPPAFVVPRVCAAGNRVPAYSSRPFFAKRQD